MANKTLRSQALIKEEGDSILEIINTYAKSWSLLLKYDDKSLPKEPPRPTKKMSRLTLAQARRSIFALKKSLASKGEASELFGMERDEGLAAILGNIEQTFGGLPLYPNAETRSANLLYFLIKDHPFADGNKRIGSLLFLQYLEKNDRLMRLDGTPYFDSNALVALALLIAESDRTQRDIMISLILGLLE